VAQGHDDVLGLYDVLSTFTDFYQRNPINATAEKAFGQGYVILQQHGVKGEPGYGVTVWIDSDGIYGHKGPDGAWTQGPRYAIAELNGVTASELSLALPYYDGNFQV
jgi:hypothetical protein